MGLRCFVFCVLYCCAVSVVLLLALIVLSSKECLIKTDLTKGLHHQGVYLACGLKLHEVDVLLSWLLWWSWKKKWSDRFVFSCRATSGFMEIWMLNMSVKRAKVRAVAANILFHMDCVPLCVPLCSFQNFAACFATFSKWCSVPLCMWKNSHTLPQNQGVLLCTELAFWAKVTWKVHLAKEMRTVGKQASESISY